MLSPEEVNIFCETFDSETGERSHVLVNVKTVIDFSGLCLVEETGCDDDWLMGQKSQDGNIYCWGNYGNLKEAIRGL